MTITMTIPMPTPMTTPMPMPMKKYSLQNIHTCHTFLSSDDLKTVTTLYHKIPRRKNSAIAIIDNTTGEIIKMK